MPRAGPAHGRARCAGPPPRPVPAVSRAQIVAVAALLLALFAVFTALFAVFAPRTETPDERAAAFTRDAAVEEGDLLRHMVLFQRYFEKAALASEAGNAELAAFYAQKIEENAALVVDGGFVIDGQDVSEIAAQVALPRAAALVEAAEAGGDLRPALAQMALGCNACHIRSGYGLVQVEVPGGADRLYPSQDFRPLSARRGE